MAVIGLALSLGACASITRGTDEEVVFQSEPAGAAVATSTGANCPATPCTIKIARKQEFVATFSKPGYASRDVKVTTKLNGGGGAAFAGNALVGGVIGAGVDAYNGSALDHDPNPVSATLSPAGRETASRRAHAI
ncbi:MAG: translation initiation factor 2 [Methylobacteriaceae bacterium]|nr:translation initiation factor 2 [Methylobacteriaceae bacterium]